MSRRQATSAGLLPNTYDQQDQPHEGEDRRRRQFAEVLGDADVGEFGDHHA
jgi:hypothetical protein